MNKLMDLKDDPWIGEEEAIKRTRDYFQCTRKQAIEILNKIEARHPEIVRYAYEH